MASKKIGSLLNSLVASVFGRDGLQNYHEYGQYPEFTGYPI
jgi:hypothetical protein